MEDAANPRTARGATLDALAQEDLDLYSIEDLDERTARLETEIQRVAADALFGGGNR